MSLPALYNVPLTEEGLYRFAFENQQHHNNVLSYLAQQGKISNPTNYPLDPMPLFAINEWLWKHQQVHNVMNAAVGNIGSDLTSVDFKNEEQLTAWIETHAREHQDIAQLTGV